MTVVNMGTDFNKAAEESAEASKPAPGGTYELQVKEVSALRKDGSEYIDKNGNPFLMWFSQIVGTGNPNIDGKFVNLMTYIPHNGDFSQVDRLVNICKAVGKPWEGESFDTDDYGNLTFKANIIISKDGKWNEIESFVE